MFSGQASYDVWENRTGQEGCVAGPSRTFAWSAFGQINIRQIARVVYFGDVLAKVSVGFNLNLSLLLSDFHQNFILQISVKISGINL